MLLYFKKIPSFNVFLRKPHRAIVYTFQIIESSYIFNAISVAMI